MNGHEPDELKFGARHTRLQWSLLAVISLLLLYGFVGARFIPTPRPVGFRLVITVILCFNALWWSVADGRFVRHVSSPRRAGLLRLAAAAFCIALNLPMLYMLAAGRMPNFLWSPTWYASAVTIWHIGLAALLPLVAGIRLLILGLIAAMGRLGRIAPGSSESVSDEGLAERLLTRRALLKTACATGPMAVLVGATGISRVREGRFLIRKHEVPAPWLPDRLRGLTITHVSDLHVGRLYRPYMLPRVVDAVNRLDSDILVVTGDIVDTSNEMLPPALAAIRQMTHRYGLFGCIGNHDMIDDRADFIRLAKGEIPLLINERRTIEIGGERITIGGLDFARSRRTGGRRAGDEENAADLLDQYDPLRDGPMIALAHHPHAWDVLGPAGVPLVLSGHTHGGQIMFSPPGSASDIGLGEMIFRYIRGFYERPGQTLFVNSGVGNWFPIRVNAPAEIVQLRLV